LFEFGTDADQRAEIAGRDKQKCEPCEKPPCGQEN